MLGKSQLFAASWGSIFSYMIGLIKMDALVWSRIDEMEMTWNYSDDGEEFFRGMKMFLRAEKRVIVVYEVL